MSKIVTGRIILLPFGIDSWGIEGDDGQNYEPVNLPDPFKAEGLRIGFRILPSPDLVSVTMWGKPVKIDNPELLDE
ncbi:MAG: hypothetical protein EA409_13715 [Saprospirales bacterium]|nr:MAG: hypothetical protein EA409_13715 [Saprospirales bacterium]